MLMISMMVHRLFAIIFLCLIPLPFLAAIKYKNKSELTGIAVWRGIILAANISLIIVILTGFIIYPSIVSVKVWLTIILALALGGFLGVMAKKLKLYRQTQDHKHLKKISVFGFAYLIVTIVIFSIMTNWYSL